ncbi:MAG: hypothetical protein HOP08_06970 [Cyclobacteriaceae bacterium]|nr:hypothetical protein [Cyclobacteriaceae bacterium]
MRHTTLLLSLFFVTHLCQSQSTFGETYTKAREYYKNKEYPLFIEKIAEAAKMNPYHQGALFYSGVAAALSSKPEEAILFLKKSILIDARYDLNNPDLATLKSRKDFQDLVKLQEEMKTPFAASDTAFVIKDRQLHVEGIAYNPDSRSFYLGSIHKRKIVKVDPAGKVSDFATAPDMAAIFGVKIDAQKKFLWACSSPIAEMENFDAAMPSKVFKYELSTGKPAGSFDAPSDVKNSVFGDLVLSKKNEVFVSDGVNNLILKLNEATGKLERYFDSPEFVNIQGIVFSDDNSTIFISDYVKGLFKLDIKSKTLSKLICDLDVSLKGIDGLNFYNGKLIIIQNGVVPLRAMLLNLDKSNATVTGFKTIDRNHPAFNEPTLGTIDKGTLYYIANSQWPGYDKDHKILPAEQLQDIIILKSNLEKLK